MRKPLSQFAGALGSAHSVGCRCEDGISWNLTFGNLVSHSCEASTLAPITLDEYCKLQFCSPAQLCAYRHAHTFESQKNMQVCGRRERKNGRRYFLSAGSFPKCLEVLGQSQAKAMTHRFHLVPWHFPNSFGKY